MILKYLDINITKYISIIVGSRSKDSVSFCRLNFSRIIHFIKLDLIIGIVFKH